MTTRLMYPLNRPEVMISSATSRFDKDRKLTDEHTSSLVRKQMESLVSWTCKFQQFAVSGQ